MSVQPPMDILALDGDALLLISHHLSSYDIFSMYQSCSHIQNILSQRVMNKKFTPDEFTKVGIEACKKGDLETIQYLHSALYFHMRVAVPHGWFFYIAIRSKSLEVAKYLAPRIKLDRRYYNAIVESEYGSYRGGICLDICHHNHLACTFYPSISDEKEYRRGFTSEENSLASQLLGWTVRDQKLNSKDGEKEEIV